MMACSANEALAEAYGDMANESRSLDDEIDKALDGTSTQVADELAALKAKMGLTGDSDATSED